MKQDEFVTTCAVVVLSMENHKEEEKRERRGENRKRGRKGEREKYINPLSTTLLFNGLAKSARNIFVKMKYL